MGHLLKVGQACLAVQSVHFLPENSQNLAILCIFLRRCPQISAR